ncbi:MAG: choice-of-anchor J domain-containing protein, partial [Muribaculaceae bacterium]|nr:choice-of-anchor J domain-containing protein [Muribaculaceae bacterium]
TWRERVELKYGRTQTGEGMTNELAGPLELVNNEFVPFGKLMVPDEDGIYYFGIHGISEADMLDLVIDNFQIAEGVSALAPGLPGDIKIVPDLYGALKAEISFTAPATDLQGKPLSSLTRVEVKRNGELIKTFDSPVIGSELKFTDNPPKEGVYTYSVTGYNNEGTGLTTEASNYIGVNIPSEPVETKLVTTTGSGLVKVEWKPVETDINGNPMLAENVTYNVYSLGMETKLLAEGLKDTSYSYQAVPEGKQLFVQCAVCAVTVAGEGDPGYTDMIPVGVPYDSVYETFADGDVSYEFGALSIDEGEWQVLTDASFKDIKSRNGDNGFLACRAASDAGAELFTGLINTNGMENPAASLYVYNVVDNEDVDNNFLSIQARRGVDSEYDTLIEGTVDELCKGVPGWHRICVSLGAYSGSVVQVKITALSGVFVYTCIDDIRIDSMHANDLGVVSLSGPDLVEWGQAVNLSATIENLGAEDAGQFTVELFADGVSQEVKTVESLQAGAAMTLDFAATMPAMTENPVTYTVAINYAKDQNGDNNSSAEVKVTPVAGTLPAVTDLAAEVENDEIKLTWSEPDIENFVPAITEDFEDGEAFSAEYGDWTFVDVDDSPVGGFRDLEVPGISIGKTKGSFWLWDTAELAGDDPTFAAHSGSHYLFSLFREDDEQVDDWAISPALYGKSQKISFYAKSYSAQYSDYVEVYYSTGSLDPKDFIKVLDKKKLSNRWRNFTAEIPDGAKYFALRSCAEGGFMMMVDDVTYIPEGAKFEGSILGFDVYRDGVKINDKLIEDFSFVDTNVEKNHKYSYNVVAVYDTGLSAGSNTASVEIS